MNAPRRIDLADAAALALLAAALAFCAGLYVGTRRLAGEALSPDAEGGRTAAPAAPAPHHAWCGARPGRPAWLVRLLAAIRAVESCGGRDARDGPAGEVGPYQIGRAHWADATRFGGADWHHWWACDRRMSERAVLWYWARWAPEALAAGDAETLARVHHGGPDGAHKAQTDPYWARVRALMAAPHPATEGTSRGAPP